VASGKKADGRMIDHNSHAANGVFYASVVAFIPEVAGNIYIIWSLVGVTNTFFRFSTKTFYFYKVSCELRQSIS
jgi:hypothetical protein